MRQSKIDGLVKSDKRGVLPTASPHQQQEERRSRGEYTKVPGAHKGRDQSALTVAQQISNVGSNLTSTTPSSVVRIILLYLRLRLGLNGCILIHRRHDYSTGGGESGYAGLIMPVWLEAFSLDPAQNQSLR